MPVRFQIVYTAPYPLYCGRFDIERDGLQVSWQWMDFENQGRSDGLRLSHWTKCSKDLNGKVKPVEQGDYRYAKYNKKVGFYCIGQYLCVAGR